jgi:nicotinamidase-related amidase
MVKMNKHELAIPPHFDPDMVSKVWKVDYQKIAKTASDWSKKHNIQPSGNDSFKLCLMIVDAQNTFCIPDFELFVGGRSGKGAVHDNQKLCDFIYRNLHLITQIMPTMDTHQAMQIFHSIFLVDEKGEHPSPFTLISHEDIRDGRWRFNELLSHDLKRNPQYINSHLLHYTEELKKTGKYELTIWPYHAMLGGIGHALVSSIEEAIFFHTMARHSQPYIHVKGDNPLTEHYSVLGPEVKSGPDGNPIGLRAESLFQKTSQSEELSYELTAFDAIVIAGQAKSHCVAWTISDLLDVVMKVDKSLVEKVYLLEDCTSPVVIPGIIDYTDEADMAFKRFEDAGMHIVSSTEPIATWPGLE